MIVCFPLGKKVKEMAFCFTILVPIYTVPLLCNKMMNNFNKFQAILLNKSKSPHVKETMNNENEKIESLSAVKLLAIEIDDKLNFTNHINTL